MNIPLILSLLVVLCGLAGLVYLYASRRSRPERIQRDILLTLLLVASGGVHALSDGGVVSQSLWINILVTGLVLTFVIVLIVTVQAEKSRR